MSKPTLENKQILSITDFTQQAYDNWEVVNDGVMGGCSESRFEINEDSIAVFEGKISLENNGGFASVRCRKSYDISSCSHIKLNLKGDGKKYCFRLRTAAPENNEINRFSYDYRFNTNTHIWEDYYLPLHKFEPFFRGRALDNVAPIDRSAIRQVGFLISDKQEGPFKLKISQIAAIKD